MVGVVVKSTMTLWVSRPVTVVQPDGVVPEGKRVDYSPSATSPSTSPMNLLYDMMLAGHGTSTLLPSRCFLLTVP